MTRRMRKARGTQRSGGSLFHCQKSVGPLFLLSNGPRIRLSLSHEKGTIAPNQMGNWSPISLTNTWGEAYAIIAGVRQKVQLFIMRLCFSRRTFAMAFPTQRQECFFYGHVKAFEYFGGVPQRISYDNLGTAVKIVFERSGRAGRSRKEVQAFARRNFLVPIPETASFDPSRLSSRPRG